MNKLNKKPRRLSGSAAYPRIGGEVSVKLFLISIRNYGLYGSHFTMIEPAPIELTWMIQFAFDIFKEVSYIVL